MDFVQYLNMFLFACPPGSTSIGDNRENACTVEEARDLFVFVFFLCSQKSRWVVIQASDGKGRHFLDLVDDNFNAIEPSYTKGGPWLQSFGHSNTLCARATRAITNHAPIGEYRLRFFPKEEFKCPCGNYPIESRRHILHDCMRFNVL